MYELEYLPVAQQDMINIITYISKTLCNPMTAERLANAFIDESEKMRDFPYSAPAYHPIRPLKYEYRKLIVKNYIMFYRVNEAKKLITIARVIYGKSDYERTLE